MNLSKEQTARKINLYKAANFWTMSSCVESVSCKWNNLESMSRICKS